MVIRDPGPAERQDESDTTEQQGGSRIVPLTQRGWNTRNKILEAARRVFERDGFLNVKITDITAEAGVAAGSFYTYFDSKEETFKVLLEINRDDLLHPHLQDEDDQDHSDDPLESIRRATRAYFESYQRNTGLMRIFEQMAAMDEEFREARLERATVFMERNARSIRRLQEQGRASTDIAPELASLALSSMVSRVAQLVFNFGYPVEDLDELIDVVVQLWVRSLDVH